MMVVDEQDLDHCLSLFVVCELGEFGLILLLVLGEERLFVGAERGVVRKREVEVEMLDYFGITLHH